MKSVFLKKMILDARCWMLDAGYWIRNQHQVSSIQYPIFHRGTLKYFVLLLLTFGCTHKSEYRKMVEKEMAKEVRVDSLFMGLEFGMTRKEFFAHCWELNKQGLFRDGPGNATVEYETNELKYPAYMHFYPAFHEGKIYEIPVKFKYKAWAPWNIHLFADSL